MTIKYRSIKKYKYELLELVSIATKIVPALSVVTPFLNLAGGVLNIAKGYAWDGGSGPAIDTKTIMRASLVHDALYQLMRDGNIDIKYKPMADAMLRDIAIEDGMSKFRAWYVWKAVVWFGWLALNPIKKIFGK